MKKGIITIVSLLTISISCIYFVNSYSKYNNQVVGTSNGQIAVALFEDTLESLNVYLDDMYPGDQKTYNFSVKNFDGLKIAETAMEYTIKINKGNNIPIDLKIFKDGVDITSSLINNTTNTYTFGFTNQETHNYSLVFDWDSSNNGDEYSDLLDYVDIIIDAKQIIS